MGLEPQFRCLLCQGCGSFSDLTSVVDSVKNLLTGTHKCCIPGCSVEVSGLDKLVEHISEYHIESDNIEQVLQDLEDLVSKDTLNSGNGEKTKQGSENYSRENQEDQENANLHNFRSFDVGSLSSCGKTDTSLNIDTPTMCYNNNKLSPVYEQTSQSVIYTSLPIKLDSKQTEHTFMTSEITTLKKENTVVPTEITSINKDHSLMFQELTSDTTEYSTVMPDQILFPTQSLNGHNSYNLGSTNSEESSTVPQSSPQSENNNIQNNVDLFEYENKTPTNNITPYQTWSPTKTHSKSGTDNQNVEINNINIQTKLNSKMTVNGNQLKADSAAQLGQNKQDSPYRRPNSRQGTVNEVACGVCGCMFDNNNFLQLHKVLIHSRRRDQITVTLPEQYHCNQCDGGGTLFKQFDQYVEHIRTVHNETKHSCKFCTKLFKLKGSLLVHQRVMHHIPDNNNEQIPKEGDIFNVKEEPSESFQLNEKYAREKIKSTSMISQLDSVPLIKKEDTRETPKNLEKGEIKDLIKNIEKRHSADGFICPTCGQKFILFNEYVSHVKIHDSKLWDCNFCGKKFTTKYFLKKHRRLHTGETPYSCNLCGKTFAFQQSYHKHMLYHTDEKPYPCNTCGRAFKELSTLQNHERIHTGERPFVCETCGKSFRQRVSYLVHRRIHTGVLPYNCSSCGKKFRYKVTQRTHKCTGRLGETDNQEESNEGKFQEHSLEHYLQDQSTLGVIGQTLETFASGFSTENAVVGVIEPEHNQFPELPEEIKINLLKFRYAQGRQQLGSQLHSILERTRNEKEILGNKISGGFLPNENKNFLQAYQPNNILENISSIPSSLETPLFEIKSFPSSQTQKCNSSLQSELQHLYIEEPHNICNDFPQL